MRHSRQHASHFRHRHVAEPLAIAGLILIVLTLVATAHAALPTSNPAWEWQNPLPHGDDMESVFFLSSTDGWAVGLGRGFLHTTDAGATWSADRVGPPLGFLDVAFSDADHGWAVGESSDQYDVTGRAVMYKSTDAGAHWSNVRVEAAPDIPLGGVAFSGTLDGWAVGRWGTVLHTADGGDTWTLQDTPDEAAEYDFTGVDFTSTTTGWAFGDASGMSGIVLATTDGGATWTIVDHESVPLWAGDAWGTQTAWAAGMGLTIAVTTDGGATWSHGATPTPIGLEDVTGIEFTDAQHGVACTDSSRILRTADGGVNWTVAYTGDGTPFSTIGVNGADGLALGDDGFTVATSDGGATWTELSTGSRQVIGRLSFVSTDVGWACGAAGTVLHTADGGSHWTPETTGTTRNLYGIDFVSATRGWIVGAHGLIRRSTDGGATWQRQRSGTGAGLGGVDLLSASRGWAVGADGLVLRTTTGGRTWNRQSSGTRAAFLDVQFINRYRGWACGTEGIVARTTNGGRTWSRTHLRVLQWPGSTLYSVCFVSRTEGWVCGVSPAGMDTLGVVFHTTDGGRTWRLQGPTPQKTVPEMTISGIDFTDSQHGWAVGDHGLLIWTANGGRTWRETVRPTPDEMLLDIDMVSATVGYAAGTGGTIINTTTGGH